MKIASLADVKAKLNTYINDSQSTGPVVVTRNGKAVALLVAPSDDEELERLIIAHSPKFQAIVQKSEASIAAGKGIPHKDFWKAAKARQQAKRSKSKRKS